ncbi:MAG: ABC transporter ATP-binding protein [Methylocystis silviterrae]|uniref:ABC transporter ATP-binding protein n=1 Tax=Methylocystis silviterrae TaxID=2743612 RepID=UPI003C753503
MIAFADKHIFARFPKQLLDLRYAARLVWRASARLTVVRAALSCVLALLPVANLYLIKLIIDTITSDALSEHDWRTLMALLASAAGLAVLTDCLRALDIYFGELLSQRVERYVSNLLNSQSVRLDLAYYENSDFQDSLHRAQSDAPFRSAMIVDRLIGALQAVVSLTGILWLLATIQSVVTIAVLLAMAPSLVVQLNSASRRHRYWRNQTTELRQKHYVAHLLTHQEHAKEVRLFDLGHYLRQKFERLQDSIHRDQRVIARDRAVGAAIAQGCGSLATYGALAFLAYQTAMQAFNIGDLVVYYQGLLRAQAAMREMFASAVGLFETSLFLSNFYDFLGLEPLIREPKSPVALTLPLKGEIRFENVAFEYPRSTRGVLKNFNLSIRAGETIALVGANGAGKTTIVKLLCRLCDPTDGRITVDGVDLRNLASYEWRKEIRAVFQDFGRYQFTARENIGFGDLSALYASERIEKAAELGGAVETIAHLSQGYDTRLGTLFPGGEELSIGQWQQIAIARAALRPASIVILDEPTSALDPRAELEMLDKFQQMAEGRTAILISHRLSTVHRADRIIVIDGGEVRETGTHAELMQLNGIYANMFHSQSRRYHSVEEHVER